MSLEDEVEWDPDLEDSANSSEIDDDLVLGAFAFYLECEKGKVPRICPSASAHGQC